MTADEIRAKARKKHLYISSDSRIFRATAKCNKAGRKSIYDI